MFFRKTARRMAALEGYLGHFGADELGYLNDLAVTGLCSPYEHSDKSSLIDLIAFIHTAWAVRTGKVPNTVGDKVGYRGAVRIKLAAIASRLTFKGCGDIWEWLGAFSDYKTWAEVEKSAEDRLGLHLTMLERVDDDPKHASMLPELEAINEAAAWEKHRRV